MLLHASNCSFCLYGCDIDPVYYRISAINGVLYAPWITFPFPAHILGVSMPALPSDVLRSPGNSRESAEGSKFRVDDEGQGLLFDLY